jgi:hypothetical protein
MLATCPTIFWFTDPVDPAEIDQVDPAGVLAVAWGDGIETEDNPQLNGAPFTGLAPAENDNYDEAVIASTLEELSPAYIGLVAANRPADALAAAGWIVFDNLLDHSKIVTGRNCSR